ncbi:MAG: putative sulfate exporter family transporter [Polyangiaceae bacterium]|nr:putative sulfate exporter family transporter [Polyangiaceae bacterium]
MVEGHRRSGLKVFGTEDTWAIWLGLAVILVAMLFFWQGSTLKPWAVTPGEWSGPGDLAADLSKHGLGYLSVFVGLGAVFALSMKVMGHRVGEFLRGYALLFVGALATFYLATWSVLDEALRLDAPLLALLLGLLIGNLKAMPTWFRTSLRTEYYIKTGIVLLGATLPLTLIAEAGPVAFVQATIVSVTTWLAIYLAATRLFKLEPRFGAVLGTGGAVCGVSGAIAVGGAVKAHKDHIAIAIAVVSVWAIVMIFSLVFLTRVLIVPHGVLPQAWYQITPGQAGAWVGTSEFADAAGFAVVAELSVEHGDGPIHAFTLMKVIGRDIWIGIWAFVLSIVSVVYWESSADAAARGPRGRVGVSVIWERFPKFVLGFLVASVLMSLFAASAPADHTGVVGVEGTYVSKAGKRAYDADFSAFRVPDGVQDRFRYDPSSRKLAFRGKMSADELQQLSADADAQQRLALANLQYHSDWFASELEAKAIGPIKKLRSWAFVLCFLSIGLSTRFRDLATFGLKPFWAFTLGVLVNVPLGFVLTTKIFSRFWQAIS